MRQLAHIAVALLFWLILLGLWVMLVIENKATPETLRDTVFRISVVTGVVLAVTTWWIRHNVGIYQRKGPRRGRATVAPRVDEDRLGRRIRWSMPGGVRTARARNHLVIELDDDVKRYSRAD
jgi:hypothetical protein